MQGEASIGEMIRFSWAKSREILFPFNFSRWLKILIIVSLAGAGVQGCSANFSAPHKSAKSRQVPAKTRPAPAVGVTSTQGVTAAASGNASAVQPQGIPASSSASSAEASPGSSKPGKAPVWSFWLVGGMILLGLGLSVFFIWLSCRFNFILLETVVSGNTGIRGPFREHREIGNSYFKWSLAFLGITLASFLIVGLVTFGLFVAAKGHIVLIIALGVLAGLLALGLFLGMIVIGTVMQDMVLPVMYREKIPAMDALNQFLDANTFAFGKVFQYLLVIFGLGLAASIAQGIVAIIAGLGGLIAGGIVIVPGFFLLKALPFLKWPLIILGAFVVIAVILAVIVVIGMVMLPVALFFRTFALAYLTRLYPDCDLLGFQEGISGNPGSPSA